MSHAQDLFLSDPERVLYPIKRALHSLNRSHILLQRALYSLKIQLFCKRYMILSHMHDLSLSDHVVTIKRALHSLNRAL